MVKDSNPICNLLNLTTSDPQVTGRWKWPKSADGLVRVPYKIPSGLSKERRGDIAKTVKEFKDKTCIRYTLVRLKVAGPQMTKLNSFLKVGALQG